MNLNTFSFVWPLLFTILFLFEILKELKKTPRSIKWYFLGLFIFVIFYLPLYFNLKLKEWQIQVVFATIIVFIVFIGYKINVEKLKIKKRKKD